ncbi:energy transducer TonB [Thermodesulfobacteriota bacterium]
MVRAYLPQGMDTDLRTFWFGFSISTACHLILFAAFIFSPKLRPERTFSPAVINVSMVSLADLGIAPSSTGPALSQPSKAVSGASKKWKTKKSLKKESYKRSKIVKKAVSRIEKKVEEKPPERLIEAIDRVGEEVERTRPVDRPVDTVVKEAPRQGGGVPGIPSRPGTGGNKALELIDIYRNLVAIDIQKNWAFPMHLAGGRTDLRACLSFKIMRNGEIRDIRMDKRSGNRYLDEAGRKAIIKSSPVSPLPPGINKPYDEWGVCFKPEGLK